MKAAGGAHLRHARVARPHARHRVPEAFTRAAQARAGPRSAARLAKVPIWIISNGPRLGSLERSSAARHGCERCGRGEAPVVRGRVDALARRLQPLRGAARARAAHARKPAPVRRPAARLLCSPAPQHGNASLTRLCRARCRVLAEVGHATEHHERILSSAVDKADGLGDADLKRLKYVVTNLKGGVLELSAHARFVDGTQQRARALFACLVRAPLLTLCAAQP